MKRPPLLTAKQVAERLSVPVSWVYTKARRREIPAVKVGRYWRFDEDVVLEYLARDPIDPADLDEAGLTL